MDWSVAIIGLCQAVEIEVVHRTAEPLRLSSRGRNITVDLKDPSLAELHALRGQNSAFELGSLSRFFGPRPIQGIALGKCALVRLREVTKAWPSADWLFANGPFTDAVEHLTRLGSH